MAALAPMASISTTPVERSEETTFRAAVPYALLSATASAGGAVMALACAATALKVIGILAAVMGAFAFTGVVICGLANAGDPKGFRENVGKVTATLCMQGFVEICSHVAVRVLDNLIDRMMRR
jgi:hypothetical protein